jgi:hypothetical protein
LVPKSLPTIHKYNYKTNYELPEKELEKSWYGRLTQSNIFKTCVVCGSSTNIQMHHLRKVLNIRTKTANSKATFDQWIGATRRKQIPLCQYHHSLYHSGKLLNYEITKIANYQANLSADFMK